jgi:hypothetical protein
MQKIVQIENVSLEDLLKGIRSAVVQDPKPLTECVTITILTKKDAAKTLNISETLFSKLQERGLIPCTVNAGVNNDGRKIQRWCEHHLILIKPTIQKLKYIQSDQDYVDARKAIRQILGL